MVDDDCVVLKAFGVQTVGVSSSALRRPSRKPFPFLHQILRLEDHFLSFRHEFDLLLGGGVRVGLLQGGRQLKPFGQDFVALVPLSLQRRIY